MESGAFPRDGAGRPYVLYLAAAPSDWAPQLGRIEATRRQPGAPIGAAMRPISRRPARRCDANRATCRTDAGPNILTYAAPAPFCRALGRGAAPSATEVACARSPAALVRTASRVLARRAATGPTNGARGASADESADYQEIFVIWGPSSLRGK